MRQFDVFVWGDEESLKTAKPAFEDPALGWFFGNNINDKLMESDAEWFVFAHSCITIDRDFLNDLAQAIEGYPMVDAFAPRIAKRKNSGEVADFFLSGNLLQPGRSFSMLAEDSPMHFVATPFPALAAFSRRIVQRTGRIDDTFPMAAQFADYSLRMYHAGGKMFSLPFLVANSSSINPEDFRMDEESTAFVLYKNLGFMPAFKYILRHMKYLPRFWKGTKEFEERRQAAILLSKLKKPTLNEITVTRK